MATWNERIDNLQARLANLVSEEFAGANFYNTNIAVSDYNPTIDTTVTLTITVTNAEGDPVEDASVPVTASEGQFTKLNNTTITAASSVTGTTNSSGQFTLTYSCTEWGLITFSANTTTTQIRVKGFKTETLTNVTLYYDEEKVMAVVNYHPTGTYAQDYSWRDFTAISNVPEGLRPSSSVYSETASQNLRLRLANNGVFQFHTPNTSVSAPYIQCILTWYLP